MRTSASAQRMEAASAQQRKLAGMQRKTAAAFVWGTQGVPRRGFAAGESCCASPGRTLRALEKPGLRHHPAALRNETRVHAPKARHISNQRAPNQTQSPDPVIRPSRQTQPPRPSHAVSAPCGFVEKISACFRQTSTQPCARPTEHHIFARVAHSSHAD